MFEEFRTEEKYDYVFASYILEHVLDPIAVLKMAQSVLNPDGLLMIVVWGLAYLSAATISSNIRWLAGAFALEKLVYGVVWIKWLSVNSLTELYAKDVFAGVFYSIYGINDLLFMLFFAWVFLSRRSGE